MDSHWKLDPHTLRPRSDGMVSLWVYAVAAGFTAMHTGLGPAEAAARMRPRAPLPELVRVHRTAPGAFRVAGGTMASRGVVTLEHRALADDAPFARAVWLGPWNGDVREDAARMVTNDLAAGRMPVLVVANLPDREYGFWSDEGGSGLDEYRLWMEGVAEGVGMRPAAVILEPDGLAALERRTPRGRRMRMAMLRTAVDVLTRRSDATVYLDAGHPTGNPPATVARRIREVGGEMDGFALSVSSIRDIERSIRYGEEISRLSGGLRFVVGATGRAAASRGTGARRMGDRSADEDHPELDGLILIEERPDRT